ncbi:MAG: NOP5/NOP56 family protein [Promethearchaeota archaeon]
MDGVLILSTYGLWCLDEHLGPISQTSLGDDVEETAASVERILHGEHDSVLELFLSKAAEKDVERFLVESQQLAKSLSEVYGVKAVHYEDVALWRNVRVKIFDPIMTSESRAFLHEIALRVSRLAIREASEQKDQLIVQAMAALDDVEKTLNLIASRLREWYGLHYPEATQNMENMLHLARIIVEGGQREEIQDKLELVELLPKNAVKPLTSDQSMGAEISSYDMAIIQALAQQFIDLQRLRERLEKYLEESMQEVAPNLRGLIGPVLGARLIGLAGSIGKLAKLPSSTIQVLGAERALFRALKTGARPPKHGVIFQHTLVHSAPWWQRGKIARILAGKIAIAARIDMYSGEYVAEELKESLAKRIAEVKEKYPTGPKAKPSPKEPHRQTRIKSRRKQPHRKDGRSHKRARSGRRK